MLFIYTRCATRVPRLNSNVSLRYFTNTTRKALPLQKTPLKPVGAPASPQAVAERGRPEKIQLIAAKLLETGRGEIYRNTASKGYVTACLSILVLSYGCIGYIYSTRLWDIEAAKARGLKWYVPVAYQITMVAWGGLAAYAFSRTIGLVKSIKLAQSGEKFVLQTAIRRPVPFLRPEIYTSEPHSLTVSRGQLYSATHYENMIVASEGQSIISRVTRAIFYRPFHNTRKALGGVGLVPIQVGPTGAQRHLFLDTDGLFSNGGKDLLEISKDEI